MSTMLPLMPLFDLTEAGCRVRTVESAAQWNALFRALPHPHLMQAYAYGEAKRQASRWHVERVVFEQGSRPVAMCQALEGRVLGVRLATRINRGPVFFDETPSHAAREAVMRLVRARWGVGRGGPLLIAPALDDSAENRTLLTGLGFRARKKRGWVSSRIDLRQSEDEIRKRLSSSWRNHLKGALKSGLELRVSNSADTLRWMLARHVENMRSKGFGGPKPALLRALHQASPAQFQILQALHQGAAVGGMILAHFGCSAEHYVGWFGETGRKLGCGNFLYWNAVCEAKKAGLLWFDVGGYESNEKFGHFKQNMRGVEYRLAGEWIGF
jgi:hypothetical protein